MGLFLNQSVTILNSFKIYILKAAQSPGLTELTLTPTYYIMS